MLAELVIVCPPEHWCISQVGLLFQTPAEEQSIVPVAADGVCPALQVTVHE